MTAAVRVALAADDMLEITLAAPEHGNALDPAMADAMMAALRDLPENAKGIVLTAEGADFCAGRRGGAPRDASVKLTALDIRKRVIEPILDLYQALRNAPVPVFAAVQGRAAGVGCALVPRSSQVIRLPNIVFRPVDLPKEACVEVFLAWRRGNDSPIVEMARMIIAENAAIDV